MHSFGPAVSISPDWPHVVMHCCCGRILDDYQDMEEDVREGNLDRNFFHWIDSKAECIRDETHWPALRALICVVSATKKDTSSTTGMNTSLATSRLLSHRAAVIVPDRMIRMERAIIERDFTAFAELTMQDSNQFHATCLDTYPPIFLSQ
jgi:mevalonate pyrophosphate decarboxylase